MNARGCREAGSGGGSDGDWRAKRSSQGLKGVAISTATTRIYVFNMVRRLAATSALRAGEAAAVEPFSGLIISLGSGQAVEL